jgi:EipB-like
MRDVKNCLLALIVLVAFVTQAASAELAAHRALYELSPSRVDHVATVVPMDGRLAYELTGSACDGYTVNYRIANRFQDPEKGEKIVDTQLKVFEAADGSLLDVQEQQVANNEDVPAQHLSVTRSNLGEVGVGKITSPDALDFSLAADVLFPSALEIKLLNEAAQGITHDASLVFDGSDGQKVLKAITFIGKKRPPGTFAADHANAELNPLAGLSSWPMSTSYYPTEGAESDTVSYQASFNMYENGVSSELVFEYGQYALKGKLTKLELLKSQPCDKAKIKP